MKKIILLVCILFLMFGCNDKNNKNEVKVDNSNKVAVKYVTCDEMKELVKNGAVLIDVRELDEFKEGHLDGAINISYTIIGNKIKNIVDDLDKDIVVYCKSGGRSSKAASTLINEGYKNIYDLGSINNCIN